MATIEANQLSTPPSQIETTTAAEVTPNVPNAFNKPLQLPSPTRAVIIPNLTNYAGGKSLWGTCATSSYLPCGAGRSASGNEYSAAAHDDGLLEVVAIGGIYHMG